MGGSVDNRALILGGQTGTAAFRELALQLNGRDFATLNALELNLFRALRATGREFGIVVSVDVIHDDENIQAALAAASPEQQEEVYRRLQTEVAVQWAAE